MSDIDFTRDPNVTPIERTIRLVATHPELHDHMAFNGWLYASDYWGRRAKGLEIWNAMSANDKQPWLDRVTDRLEEMRHMTPEQIDAENRLHLRGVIKRNNDALRALPTNGRQPDTIQREENVPSCLATSAGADVDAVGDAPNKDAKPSDDPICWHCDRPKSRHWARELYCSPKGYEFRMGPWFEADDSAEPRP